MDGDPSVEDRLDSFSLTFPLPYRVASIIVLGVWGWALNLHYLYALQIDVPSLIRYPPRVGSQPPHHKSTYRLATFLSATLCFSIVVFWLLTHRDPKLVIDYDWWPMTYLLLLAALFVIPLRSLAVSHTGRSRLLWTLKRISVGGLAEAKDGKFGDILLADALTSYAKVLGDLFVCLCMFLSRGGSATKRPDRNCGGDVFVPLLMAVPSMIRLRQCLIEYLRVRRAPYKESVGWGGQHLANAAKYATAFPVIIFSALQRNLPTQDRNVSTGLYRAWLVAMLVNSLYSFYWDVTKDWDLTLFSGSRERNSPDHPYGLRRRLMIHKPAVYYAIIGMDLALRCTWVLKLTPGLDHVADFESSIFIIEFLEVFRRWVWVFFRTEAEWLRNTTTGLGLGVDDILLGVYDSSDKYDSDD